LKQVKGTDNIDVGIKDGIGDRLTNVNLRRVVVQHLRPKRGEHPFHFLNLTHVHDMKCRLGWDIGSLPVREIIYNGNLMTLSKVSIHHMRSDKTCATRDQNIHGIVLSTIETAMEIRCCPLTQDPDSNLSNRITFSPPEQWKWTAGISFAVFLISQIDAVHIRGKVQLKTIIRYAVVHLPLDQRHLNSLMLILSHQLYLRGE
jgi:hypothetical protein